MASTQRMSERAYEQFVLTGAEGAWELHDGVLVEKPGISFEHGDIVLHLSHLLQLQLDRRQFRDVPTGRDDRSGRPV